MDDIERRLQKMFDADRETRTYEKKFPWWGFVHHELGLGPHHPPAELVWQVQGDFSYWGDKNHLDLWQQVWETLRNIHIEYRTYQ